MKTAERRSGLYSARTSNVCRSTVWLTGPMGKRARPRAAARMSEVLCSQFKPRAPCFADRDMQHVE
jgi:hypothetical protein